MLAIIEEDYICATMIRGEGFTHLQTTYLEGNGGPWVRKLHVLVYLELRAGGG